ncbi:Glucanosyltransferase-domain-containing protein [Gongronella butleri]|nr:Glucanosyltransferase-domain-containing protein [Gongronella butleri]
MVLRVFVLLCSLGLAVGLNPIVIKGHKFFDEVTKEQFFIKGVAYQPRGQTGLIDPLADATTCARDAALMSKLGLNLVRVYEVDPRKDHSQCMKSLADAGIYVLLDIATPKNSINRQHPDYTVQLFNAYKTTVNAFHDFDNMFGYIAGNEVTNDKTNTPASPFVKAAVRDVKHYIRQNKKKYLPVGYANNDDDDIRDAIRDYFSCGDEPEQVDFYGVNIYEWCGASSYRTSGYSKRTEELAQFAKPVFLSEYGCNLASPRPFTEVEAIYSKPMTDVWSGGIAYEWTQEANNYGLVKVNGPLLGGGGNNSTINGTAVAVAGGNSTTTPITGGASGGSSSAAGEVELLPDFKNLQEQLSLVKPQGVMMDSFNEQRTVPKCPPNTQNWKASTKLPPTPSDAACQCMTEAISCSASDKVTRVYANGTAVIGAQLDAMCGLVSCKDISGNGETADYGAFSFCSPKEKLSWLYHMYSQNNKGTCDFDGNAVRVTPKRKDIQACATLDPDLSTPKDANPGNDSTNTAAASIHTLPTLGPLCALVLFVIGSLYTI